MFLFVCVFLDVIFIVFLGLLLFYLMFLLLYLCVMCVCRISIKITYLLTCLSRTRPLQLWHRAIENGHSPLWHWRQAGVMERSLQIWPACALSRPREARSCWCSASGDWSTRHQVADFRYNSSLLMANDIQYSAKRTVQVDLKVISKRMQVHRILCWWYSESLIHKFTNNRPVVADMKNVKVIS